MRTKKRYLIIYPLPRYIQLTALVLSAVLVLSLFWAYIRQPDSLAAITFMPVWFWAPFGLTLTLLGFARRRKWPALGLVAIWFVYLVALADEPWSLLRSSQVDNTTWQVARFEERGIRVVSLNCGEKETVEAAEEVRAYVPDLVLLQEAPDLPAIQRMAERLYGPAAAIAYYPDRAIIAHGAVTDVRHVGPGAMLRARVTLASGQDINVFCVHLLSPARRRIFLAPSNIRDHAERRRLRRRQMEVVAQQATEVPETTPLLIGGDFNAPQRDILYRMLRPRVRDTFAHAGVGWGNTILNDMPILRIDQIWVSRHFQPVAVSAHRTHHSDHRMVVCDLMWVDDR